MFNFVLLLSFFSFSRLALICLALYEQQIDFQSLELIKTLGLGVINDLVTSFYCLAPLAIFGIMIPRSIKQSRIFTTIICLLYFLLVLALCFMVVAEFTFWLEFSTRFNFIAVDYLVYTHEVIGNIRESYPIFVIFPAIILVAVIIKKLTYKKIDHNSSLLRAALLSLAVILSFFFYNPKITDVESNNFLSELNKNGMYNLFSAFRHNSIDYASFYMERNEDEALKELADYIAPNSKDSQLLAREIATQGKPKDYNVFLITIESMSSDFLDDSYLGRLTPVMQELIKQSIYFDKFYATGTRTVRGLEALTLGIPPLPGQSILRRENNSNLFSIGSVLKSKGYDLKFIYGGYGYFDNMNSFFAKNNFKIWDRSKMPKNEIGFTNIWGVSDEDLYSQAINQADLSYSEKQKFFSLVMTTSNHRPYTFPKDESEFPHNRLGGVKYSDYALGEFLKKASSKPWFDNTIFVITADHCAGSAGKVALPPEKYHIPLIIYAPKIIAPQVISKMSSQIDVAPTILGLLNVPYTSRFFGNDIFTKTYQNAFISTFQKLGYMENDKLVVLSPGKLAQTYKILENDNLEEVATDKTITNHAIDYYQSAYNLFQKGLLKDEVK